MLECWEGDTIRTTPAKGVDSVSSQKVYDAIKEAFNEKGIHSKNIVFDNGYEFANFREPETALQIILQTFTVHGSAALMKI